MSLADVKKCARIHNVGPSGHTSSSTLEYWDKFKSYLPGCSGSTESIPSLPSLPQTQPQQQVPQQNQPQSGGPSNNSGKKMGKLLGQYAPKPATSGDCGRFPSVNLRAITDEDQVEDHANYNDPQDMNTCLFKVNHPP